MTGRVERIEVTVQMGDDRLAASDDPTYLGLRGPSGREFRLAPAKGKAWRRGARETFTLGAGSASNVAHPELNDPASPPLEIADVTGVYLRKGLDPIPNVRGHGEMDDRLQVVSIEVEIHAGGDSKPVRFARRDPFWLGLVCGLLIDLPPEAEGRE